MGQSLCWLLEDSEGKPGRQQHCQSLKAAERGIADLTRQLLAYSGQREVFLLKILTSIA